LSTRKPESRPHHHVLTDALREGDTGGKEREGAVFLQSVDDTLKDRFFLDI
jgi:hypothetical protein